MWFLPILILVLVKIFIIHTSYALPPNQTGYMYYVQGVPEKCPFVRRTPISQTDIFSGTPGIKLHQKIMQDIYWKTLKPNIKLTVLRNILHIVSKYKEQRHLGREIIFKHIHSWKTMWIILIFNFFGLFTNHENQT